MTAETLRRAAALMRERAEAVERRKRSPWKAMTAGSVAYPMSGRMWGTVAETFPKGGSDNQADVTVHIASWHPAVALAVAGMLENEALAVDDLMRGTSSDAGWALVSPAMEVALTFLGELDDESFRPERGAE